MEQSAASTPHESFWFEPDVASQKETFCFKGQEICIAVQYSYICTPSFIYICRQLIWSAISMFLLEGPAGLTQCTGIRHEGTSIISTWPVHHIGLSESLWINHQTAHFPVLHSGNDITFWHIYRVLSGTWMKRGWISIFDFKQILNEPQEIPPNLIAWQRESNTEIHHLCWSHFSCPHIYPHFW